MHSYLISVELQVPSQYQAKSILNFAEIKLLR